jgi:ferredoxin
VREGGDAPSEKTTFPESQVTALERAIDLAANNWLVVNLRVDSRNQTMTSYDHWACHHCIKPACQGVCPVTAITKLPSGPVVIDEKNLNKLTSLMPKKSIRNIAFNLSEIIVLLDESTEKIPGVLAAVAEEVAIKGINIVEFMSCIPELIIVVDERDALSCYESLQRLSKSSRKL